MGGVGSGRYWHWGTKNTTDSLLSLDVRLLKRGGHLEPGRRYRWRWSIHGEEVASIQVTAESDHLRLVYRSRSAGEDWEPMDYKVRLLSQPCHLGGQRTWFACPARGCGRRVAILYGGRVYACRHCYDLAYPSQRERPMLRHMRRSDALQRRLGWETDLDLLRATKPKGMHWRTYRRLVDEYNEAELMADLAMAPFLSKFDMS